MRRALWLSPWALAAMAQIQPMPPASAGKGVIEGIAVNAATHESLKKAQVTLSGGVAQPLMAVTDAGGRFAFRGLPAGSYWLNASKPGYNPPQTMFEAESSLGVMLGDGEQRKGLELGLTPGASIGGRVTNEEGAGVRGCAVTAVRRVYRQNRSALMGVGGASSGDGGAYRIRDLAAGRYYVFTHCRATLPAPHALLPRGDPRTPHEAYEPRFYGGAAGGGPDPSAAVPVTLSGGAGLEGIDFQVSRVPAFTVRGAVGGDMEAMAGGVNLMLVPASRAMRDLIQWSAMATAQNRAFEIRPVIPGSYVLYAFNQSEGGLVIAQHALEIGPAAPGPVEISLAGGMELKGSVQTDGEDHLPPAGVRQVTLWSLDGPFFMPLPHGETAGDGTFTLTGVQPGRWRLSLSGTSYIKSVTLGGQPVSPYDLDIGAAAPGPLVIVVGTHVASVTVHIVDAPPDRQVAAVIFPEDAARLGAGLERAGTAMGTDQVRFGGLPPGRYRVFAADIPQPWPILQRPDLLRALESRTAVIEAPEGGQASTTVEIIPRQEVMRAIEAQE